MTKWFITALVLLLIISNAFWLLLMIDTSITKTYQQQSQFELNQTLKSYRQLCHQLIAGQQKSQVLNLLTNIDKDAKPFEKEGFVHSDWLSIKIVDNKAAHCSDSIERLELSNDL